MRCLLLETYPEQNRQRLGLGLTILHVRLLTKISITPKISSLVQLLRNITIYRRGCMSRVYMIEHNHPMLSPYSRQYNCAYMEL
jgi:hypothetical protein